MVLALIANLGIFELIFILFLLGIYFIPSIIAWVKKNNFTLVILINVFAGWTGIGWIAAFVLSVVKIKSK